ncbi:MAG TPA: ECF-type sigma factor [Gemmataceae bacterium]|nr:ECF-type sigma factor [Gemmataceae bacterium]
MPSSNDNPGSISQAFQELRDGDGAAAARLWERFFPRLHGLARKALAGRPQRAADADDAVQSAFATFVRRAQQGVFGPVLDRDDLWSLLGVIAVRKARKQVRRESAAKRGQGRILDEAALAADDERPGLDALAGTPAADFDLHCQEMLAPLDDELRTIAILRLLGHRNREIAEQLGCTERRVERKLALIRQCWHNLYPV